MAFPRLSEVFELWSTLPTKINAIGDYFEAAAATLAGKVTKSVTTDEDGKAQLVNDLADGELVPDLVYGTDSEGARGWKEDYGGRIGETPVDTETAPTDGQVPIFDEATGKYIPGAQAVDSGLVGTREVDETAIADGRILAFNEGTGKVEYVEDQTGSGDTGKVGTKDVDEADIGDGKVLQYSSGSGKLVYVTPSSGSVDTEAVIKAMWAFAD